MTFVYPAFLFALLTVAVPIIIHLFNFRRYKKIIFSDIRFLKQVQEETKSRRRLKEWLILAARVLAVTFLVFAFAQPFIPRQQTAEVSGKHIASIYIDNSFSMGSEGKNGVLIESAKNKARAIVNAYPADGQFQVMTNDINAVGHRLLGKKDALQAIDGVKQGTSSCRLSTVISKQKLLMEKSSYSKVISYIISDFQKKFMDIEKGESDSLFMIRYIPVEAISVHNLYIDSAWLMSPVVRMNSPVQLKVRIRNSGKEDAENIGVTLILNHIQKGLVNVNCAANAFTDAEIIFQLTQPGWHDGELSIIDHPVTFDDKLFFTVRPTTPGNVYCINGGNENHYIRKVFEGEESYKFSMTNENMIDYASFAKQSLVIMNEPGTVSSGLSSALKAYLNDGGTMLVVPPSTLFPATLNSFLAEINAPQLGVLVKQNLKSDHININEDLFKDVFMKLPKNLDLPQVSQYYESIVLSSTRGSILIRLNNGMPLLYESVFGKGRIFILTTPLTTEFTNLPLHSVFVPMMLKLGMGNVMFPGIYYTCGKDKWIKTDQEVTGSDKLAHIKGNQIELVSEFRQHAGATAVFINDEINKAGIFSLLGTGQDEKYVTRFAMNYNRDESVMDMADISAIAKQQHVELISGDDQFLSNLVSGEITGTSLWRVCLVLALVFIMIEIFLLKYV